MSSHLSISFANAFAPSAWNIKVNDFEKSGPKTGEKRKKGEADEQRDEQQKRTLQERAQRLAKLAFMNHLLDLDTKLAACFSLEQAREENALYAAAHNQEVGVKLALIRRWRYSELTSVVDNSVAKYFFENGIEFAFADDLYQLQMEEFEDFFMKLVKDLDSGRTLPSECIKALLTLILARFEATEPLKILADQLKGELARQGTVPNEAALNALRASVVTALSEQESAMGIVRYFAPENLADLPKILILAFSDDKTRTAACRLDDYSNEFCKRNRNVIFELRFQIVFGNSNPVIAEARMRAIRSKKAPFFGGDDEPGTHRLSQEWADFYSAAVLANTWSNQVILEGKSAFDIMQFALSKFSLGEGERRKEERLGGRQGEASPISVALQKQQAQTREDRRFMTARMFMWFLYVSTVPPSTEKNFEIMNRAFWPDYCTSQSQLMLDDFVNADGTFYDGSRFIDSYMQIRNTQDIRALRYFSVNIVAIAYEQYHATPAQIAVWVRFAQHPSSGNDHAAIEQNGYVAFELLLRDDVAKNDVKGAFIRFVEKSPHHPSLIKRCFSMIEKHPNEILLWLEAIDNFASNHVGNEKGYEFAFRILWALSDVNEESESPEYQNLSRYLSMVDGEILSFANAALVLEEYNSARHFHRNVWPLLVNQLGRLGGSRLRRTRDNLTALLGNLAVNDDPPLRAAIVAKLSEHNMQI